MLDSPEVKESPKHTGVVIRVDGGFAIEDYPRVDSRDIAEIIKESIPNLRTISIQPALVTEVKTNINGHPDTKNVLTETLGGQVYIDGQVFTKDDIRQMDDKSMIILLQNMNTNHWDKVVKTRTGKFQPFGENDSVVSSQTLTTS